MIGSQHTLGREHVIGHPALTDSQTGLANRLHFELVYSYLFVAGDRGMAFTVLLLSVGERDDAERGPERLRAIGAAIHRTTRLADLVAHVGNGRYVVLLLGTNLSGARIAADRIESALQPLSPGRISIGLAPYDTRMTDAGALLEAADRALQTAETAGGGVELA